jgi:type IV secretion system protein VirD4
VAKQKGSPGGKALRVQRQVKMSVPREPGPLTQWATRTAGQAAHASRWYAGTLGAGVVAAEASDAHELFWICVGGCAAIAGKNIAGNFSWGSQRGGAARRHRRRYQGAASRMELLRKLSVPAAQKHAIRVGLDPEGAPVIIGKSGKPAQIIAGTRADSYLAIAPPQTLKTALLSCWTEDAPGACITFSSRGDIYRHTALNRGRRGRVLVLNADRLHGVPQTLFVDPVAGCEDMRIAMRRAADFMAASPRDPSGKDRWHENRGAGLLRIMLHAAALAHGSMRDVAAWVADPHREEPMKYLTEAKSFEWAEKLAALCEQDGDFFNSVISSAEACLTWMDDPWMAAIACPPQGQATDLREFIEDGTGSIYVVGEDREYGSLSPYFAFVAAEVHHTARQVAEAQGGRLRSALTMVIDEAATICPVPLHRWSSVDAGYNITLMAAIQALSQLPARWGEHDASTILTNFTTKIVGGGFTRGTDLEDLSVLCGEYEVPLRRDQKGEQHRNAPGIRERLYPPERIRLLETWHALVIHRNTRPVEVVITPVWARPGYQKVPEPAAYASGDGQPPSWPTRVREPVEPVLPVDTAEAEELLPVEVR